MLFEPLALGALRASVLLVLALGASLALRTAAARRLVLALALGGALLVPALSAVAPVWTVVTPPPVRALPLLDLPVEGDLEAPAAPAPAAAPAAPAARLGLGELAVQLWAFGALLVALRLGVGLLRASAMARRAAPAAGWSPALTRAERLVWPGADRGARVAVRESDEVDAPAVTGLVWPVILVPPAARGWSEGRRHVVLLHELAHVRQRDTLAGLVAGLACAAHWFNPLVWLAARRLRHERELAADDAVLGAGAPASTYAEELLALAGAGRRLPEGALAMGEAARLVDRVRAVLSPVRPRGLGRSRAAVLVGAVAAITLALASAAPGSSAAEPADAASGTLDLRLQAIAEEELDRVLGTWEATAGVILVLDPHTGEVRANAGRANGAPADVALRSAYVTGSTLKPLVLAGALEDGVLRPTDRLDCERGTWTYQGQVVRDASPLGNVPLAEALAASSNIAMIKVFDRLGGARLQRWLQAFQLGVAPMEGAAAGWLPPSIEDHTHAGAVVAIGQTATTSPLQLAAAYGALANGGVWLPPTLTERSSPPVGVPVITPETARSVTTLLEAVVSSERGTGRRARVEGAQVAGKTGTVTWEDAQGGAHAYASFVGFVPSTAPRYVILVGVEQPKDGGSGGAVAAPAFAQVASRALALP